MTSMKHLNIEVTRRCNQRCIYCFNSSAPDQSDTSLSLEEWHRIIRALRKHGLTSIHVTGGEPFLWHHTIALLRAAQQSGLSTSILSNGYRIPSLLSKSLDVFASLTVAQISLDSADPLTHNRRRGLAAAHRWATDAILALRAVDVDVEVSCVIDDSNASDLPQLLSFCQTSGCRFLPRPLLCLGRAAANHSQVSDRTLRFLADLIETNRDLCVSDRFCYLPDPSLAQAHLYGFHTSDPDGTLRIPITLGPRRTDSLRGVA